MRRPPFGLVIALLTFSIGWFFWHISAPRNSQVKLREETKRQNELRAARFEEVLGEIKGLMQKTRCAAPESIKEEKLRVACAQLQMQINEFQAKVNELRN